jgi:hypothetical protein
LEVSPDVFANSSAEFGKFIVDYTEKWGKVPSATWRGRCVGIDAAGHSVINALLQSGAVSS